MSVKNQEHLSHDCFTYSTSYYIFSSLPLLDTLHVKLSKAIKITLKRGNSQKLSEL